MDALTVGPAIYGPSGELRFVIGINRPGQNPELVDLLQHVGRIFTRYIKFHCNIQTLAGNHRQTLGN